MKIPFFASPPLLALLTLLVGLALLGTTAHAQDDQEENTTSSTTYDSTGTVTAISAPLTITVNSRRGPFTYQLDQDLHVFGLNRKPIKAGQVLKGQKVTVYYYKHFGTPTVARIVVLEDAARSGK